MKKLMIAAAIVCATAVSQAASISWGSSGVQIDGIFETGEGNYANKWAVYLFQDSDYSQANMAAALQADGWKNLFAGDNKKALDTAVTGADGSFAKSAGIEVGAFTGYMVIFDAGNIDDASYAFVTKNYTTPDNSTHILLSDWDGDSWVNATDYGTKSGWTQVAAVLEPTSGLLLLLGMAGLALKRKLA